MSCLILLPLLVVLFVQESQGWRASRVNVTTEKEYSQTVHALCKKLGMVDPITLLHTSDSLAFELVAHTVRLNYADAVKHCKALDLELVRVDRSDMNKIVDDFGKLEKLGRFWIDLNDIVNEGNWVTSDGTQVVYKNFNAGEPGGGRSENCVVGNYYDHDRWVDISCNDRYAVICLRKIGKV